MLAGNYVIKCSDIKRAHSAFRSNEPRDLFYRAATELVRLAIDKKISLAVTEALAVLLQSWNRAYYRYHRSNTKRDFNKMQSLYRKHSKALALYRRRKIDSFVGSEAAAVCCLFTEFERVLGPVGAAKALHLLAPNFFPLWDRAIAHAYHATLGKVGTNGKRYATFMEIARCQYVVLNDKCTATLKLIDEYNYCKFTTHWL
jgi:hypothetical protein